MREENIMKTRNRWRRRGKMGIRKIHGGGEGKGILRRYMEEEKENGN